MKFQLMTLLLVSGCTNIPAGIDICNEIDMERDGATIRVKSCGQSAISINFNQRPPSAIVIHDGYDVRVEEFLGKLKESK